MKMNSNFAAQITVICFDFDGTVADTMPFLTDLAVEIICKYYAVETAFARNRYIETTGLPFAQQIQTIFPEHPHNSHAIAEFETQKQQNYLHLQPVNGVREVLRALQAKQYQVAISSSTFQHLIQEYVNTYQLPCDLALGYREHFKKGKDHFDYIIDTFSVKSEQICYIGDSLNDYRLATLNGIRFIAKIGLFTAEAFRQLDQNVQTIDELDQLMSIF